MKITVLAKNPVCKTNFLNVKADTGLSLFIEFDGRKILFNTGQSDLFIHNAANMGIDLSHIEYLVISHGHFDHCNGLKHFLKINKKAKIFLHINAMHKFYTRIFEFIPYYVGLDRRVIAQQNRIYFIREDTMIEDKIILLEGFTEVFPQTESDNALFEKTTNRSIVDKFNHELAMLLIENDEIVLFSGYSHSGIVNILDEVKLFSKNMKIKATFGGFHIGNSVSKKNESEDYIGELTAGPVFYSGHFAGEINFPDFKGQMGRKIRTLTTGQVIEV